MMRACRAPSYRWQHALCAPQGKELQRVSLAETLEVERVAVATFLTVFRSGYRWRIQEGQSEPGQGCYDEDHALIEAGDS